MIRLRQRDDGRHCNCRAFIPLCHKQAVITAVETHSLDLFMHLRPTR